MKTKNLLPHAWKPFGWVLLVVCISLGLWLLIDDSTFPFHAEVTIPWPFIDQKSEVDRIIDFINYKDGTITLELIDEILSLSVLAGLFIVGFARLKVEDERAAQLRLESLQWAIYGNTLVLVLCILFVHGLGFINVMIYNMFTPLLIFVLRFHWLLQVQPALEAKRERSLS
ncbi:hypothetical protein GCM10027275_49000 [Rhabdobacter roseus]|uniref:Uncharacterized protein n=1 Tax=Rhabdobacter roseus TaxID=1655419 RepID=A0A840TUP2_9BACT|nr:hypothetical protein [Rhabdobacter roseus]MBB5286964.1 hypothetical protein [Rhabdobacter roseus]